MFSDLERFLRCFISNILIAVIPILVTVSSVCRWRVQLMERAMRQLNFETVDTLLQVPICHCRCVCRQTIWHGLIGPWLCGGREQFPYRGKQEGSHWSQPYFHCTLPRMPRMNHFSYTLPGDTLLRNLFLPSSTLSSLSTYRHGWIGFIGYSNLSYLQRRLQNSRLWVLGQPSLVKNFSLMWMSQNYLWRMVGNPLGSNSMRSIRSHFSIL